MEVVWTRQAVHQLNRCADYIAQDNVIAAEKWVLSLVGKTDQLSELPKSGRIVPEYSDPNLREIIGLFTRYKTKKYMFSPFDIRVRI